MGERTEKPDNQLARFALDIEQAHG
jgi:hypothetical protein